jgi:hypothetical protein
LVKLLVKAVPTNPTPTTLEDALRGQEPVQSLLSRRAKKAKCVSGQSHLAFLDGAEQGSAILRETVGGFSSGAKAAFGASLIRRNSASANLREGGEVLRDMSLANLTSILAEGDIKHPMQGIFDSLVSAQACRRPTVSASVSEAARPSRKGR